MSEPPKEWLDRLEATVRQATESLESLRGERDELARRAEELEGRVASLEKELAAARKAGAEGAKGRGAAKGKAADGKDSAEAKAAEEARAAWQEERREIRRRVEALTKRLEGLLDG
ncbi:MAG: hypothetical protein ACLF0P_12420 [Thermoanaerobaculia bacterium]